MSVNILQYLYPVGEIKLLSRLQAVIQVAVLQLSVKAHQVRDAAPGLQADEGATGFVWGPDAVGLGLVAAHAEVGLLVLV